MSYFSISDIISDFILFTTYFEVETLNKTVPMSNDISVQNTTGRTCTFMEEIDYGYNYRFSCKEYDPMFASLTLLFIYMPSFNVLATLFGPRTAGWLSILWGSVMGLFGVILYNAGEDGDPATTVMSLFLVSQGAAMSFMWMIMNLAETLKEPWEGIVSFLSLLFLPGLFFPFLLPFSPLFLAPTGAQEVTMFVRRSPPSCT